MVGGFLLGIVEVAVLVLLPQMLGLSGLLLGVVIVSVMAFLLHGMMGNREVEDLVIGKRKGRE